MLQTTLLLRTNELCRCRREDRKITAVRVFVAAHEWIVESVGVVDIQSGEAFAAVFAPANEKDGRVSTGEAKDEASAAKDAALARAREESDAHFSALADMRERSAR